MNESYITAKDSALVNCRFSPGAAVWLCNSHKTLGWIKFSRQKYPQACAMVAKSSPMQQPRQTVDCSGGSQTQPGVACRVVLMKENHRANFILHDSVRQRPPLILQPCHASTQFPELGVKPFIIRCCALTAK